MKLKLTFSLFLICSLSGCLVAAAGVGAEAGYIVSQDNKSTSETLTDQRITATVKTKLLAHPDVSGLAINVDTEKGVVTLKGVLDSADEVDEAIALAQGVDGVKGVQSKLVVIR